LDQAGSDAMALLMLRPLLLSTFICLMDHGGLDRGPCLLPTIIHSIILIECVVTVKIPSGHMTYFSSFHPGEGYSSVALLKVFSLFFPVKGFFLFLGSFS